MEAFIGTSPINGPFSSQPCLMTPKGTIDLSTADNTDNAKSRFNPAETALLASTAVDRSVGLYVCASAIRSGSRLWHIVKIAASLLVVSKDLRGNAPIRKAGA